MRVSELWNELNCYGPNEKVEIDATGLRIGRDRHIDLEMGPEMRDLVYRAHWSDGLASDYLRTEL